MDKLNHQSIQYANCKVSHGSVRSWWTISFQPMIVTHKFLRGVHQPTLHLCMYARKDNKTKFRFLMPILYVSERRIVPKNEAEMANVFPEQLRQSSDLAFARDHKLVPVHPSLRSHTTGTRICACGVNIMCYITWPTRLCHYTQLFLFGDRGQRSGQLESNAFSNRPSWRVQ